MENMTLPGNPGNYKTWTSCSVAKLMGGGHYGTDPLWYRPIMVQTHIGTGPQWYRPIMVQSTYGTEQLWYLRGSGDSR